MKTNLLRLNLQFFAEEGEATQTEGQAETATTSGFDINQVLENPEFQKLMQSREDKIRTDYSKKLKEKEEALEKLETASLTESEKQQRELEKAQKTLAEKEKAIQEKENKLFAIEALSSAELPASFLPFVTADSDEITTEKITTLKAEFDKAVAEKAEEQVRGTARKYTKGSDGEQSISTVFAQNANQQQQPTENSIWK